MATEQQNVAHARTGSAPAKHDACDSCEKRIILPLREATALGEFIRIEHGAEGVRRFICLLDGLVPRIFLEQLCIQLCIDVPPQRAEQPNKPRDGGLSSDKLFSLLSSFGGKSGSSPAGNASAGGIDPAMLLKLLRK